MCVDCNLLLMFLVPSHTYIFLFLPFYHHQIILKDGERAQVR